jgi:putative NADH-flavin reductase
VGILDYVKDEETEEVDYLFNEPDFPDKYKPVTKEHLKAYEHLKNSKLDWTFVCPPMILNEPASESYEVKKDFPTGWPEINAGDIADFMIKELKENNFVGSRVGIGK